MAVEIDTKIPSPSPSRGISCRFFGPIPTLSSREASAGQVQVELVQLAPLEAQVAVEYLGGQGISRPELDQRTNPVPSMVADCMYI